VRRAIGFLATLGALGAVACGGGNELRPKTLSNDWVDDNGRSIGEVQRKTDFSKAPKNSNTVVAVTSSGKVAGIDLVGGTKWTYAHALDARPRVVGGLVVGIGNGELFALDAKTGAKVWTRTVGRVPFFGAGDDGQTTVVTLGQGAGNGTTLLAVTRDGSVRRQVETDKTCGVAAVVMDTIFVPWSNQYVSAIGLSTGEELGRVVFREKISHAWLDNGQLYFGEIGVYRFDENIAMASRGKASHVKIPKRELPGSPRLLLPARDVLAPAADAFDRAHLYAYPHGRPFALDGERSYASYFRTSMGFSGRDAKLQWVSLAPTSVVGGKAVMGGVVLCHEDGSVVIHEGNTGAATGNPISFGEPIQSCVVDASEGIPIARPSASALAPLASQIRAVLVDKDAQLAAVQKTLMDEIAGSLDDSATEALIALTVDRRTPAPLVAEAKKALAGRKLGAQYMLSALEARNDALHDTKAGPVGTLALALASLQEKKAARPLLVHLLDPSTSVEDVNDIATALASLAGESERAGLLQFFELNRATTNDVLAHAVATVWVTLRKLGGKEADVALKLKDDPFTSAAVKPGLTPIPTEPPKAEPTK
jgi:outer membrane protein assembly factor BamB